MSDIVELKLSKAVNVTNTGYIRAAIRDRIKNEGLDGPPVELVHFHVFIHCTAGEGLHMVDFEDYEMKPGTAIWIRPGQVQRWGNNDDGFDADVAVFQSSTIPELPLFEHFTGSTSVAELGTDSDRVRLLTDWMASDLESNHDFGTAAAVVSVVLRVFARRAEGSAELDATPSQTLTALFVDSVDSNIQHRTVAWHARQIGASARSVARATQRVLGQRPKEVVYARVTLEAQRQLAYSSEDIATVARSLGFSEPSNFTKFFRARTGTLPSEFRDAAGRLAPDSADVTDG